MFFLDLSELVTNPFVFRLSKEEWKTHFMGTFDHEIMQDFQEDHSNALFSRELLEKAQKLPLMNVCQELHYSKIPMRVFRMVYDRDVEKMKAGFSALYQQGLLFDDAYKDISKQIMTKAW